MRAFICQLHTRAAKPTSVPTASRDVHTRSFASGARQAFSPTIPAAVMHNDEALRGDHPSRLQIREREPASRTARRTWRSG